LNPFLTFEILPAYGRIEAVIRWQLAAGLTGDVYFYRSESGLPGTWTLLNPDAPFSTVSGEFMDTTPVVQEFVFVYYRGVFDPGGAPDTWLKGPAIRASDQYERSEYMLAREVLRREYDFMRVHEGLQCFHLVPKEKGTPATATDPETGQVLGQGCPEEDDQGFNTPWAGGYYPPVQTWSMIMSMGPKDHKPREDAMGQDPEADIMLRLLAFPKPGLEHIIVFPKSDRRYLIAEPITPYYLRGNLPLVWEVPAKRMSSTDMRHKLVMPELLPDPA
jgi:hypothetical protein